MGENKLGRADAIETINRCPLTSRYCVFPRTLFPSYISLRVYTILLKMLPIDVNFLYLSNGVRFNRFDVQGSSYEYDNVDITGGKCKFHINKCIKNYVSCKQGWHLMPKVSTELKFKMFISNIVITPIYNSQHSSQMLYFTSMKKHTYYKIGSSNILMYKKRLYYKKRYDNSKDLSGECEWP